MSTAPLLDDLARLREQAEGVDDVQRGYLIAECAARIEGAQRRGTITEDEANALRAEFTT